MLDYRAPEAVARTVSFERVLADDVPAAWTRDRIVLIGPTLPSLKDAFFTPYTGTFANRREMPGVVLQAQMVSQVLEAALEGQSPRAAQERPA